MVAEEIRRAAQAAPLARLCEVSAALWKAFGAGGVTEAEAEELSTLIEARRAVPLSNSGEGRQSGPPSRPPVRRPQRPPVRSVAIERRRRLAASGPMPPALAARFTTAELAALKIISDDVRASGACVLPIDAIAARAGISRTSAQNAIRQACRLGMLERQERRRAYDRSLPSILRVVDREWSAWLRRGPQGVGSKVRARPVPEIQKGGFERADPSKGCRGAEVDPRRSGRQRIRAGGGAG
ncbi:hypothetical protein [Methylobacterium sp. Leaf361]|uniref:hypothetical protein n=1 Tax=Methylobacterium sp. Leaf361 TaxID=1736352 RepID=UPI000A5964BD|nr:hypothetical protein [Methylobacterium sp. Leaf361]